MKRFGSGNVQDKIINRLERQEKQDAFQRDRFFRFKLPEIHSRLSQVLLMEKVIETENPAAVSDLLLKGLKQALRSNEFDLKYFIAPIRDLAPRPNLFSLYMTQYILEVILNDPSVIEVYGTDQEIYNTVNGVIAHINQKFQRAEEEIMRQMAKNKSLVPGSREYDVALDQIFRKKMGEPQQV
jgi:hypothetical protein